MVVPCTNPKQHCFERKEKRKAVAMAERKHDTVSRKRKHCDAPNIGTNARFVRFIYPSGFKAIPGDVNPPATGHGVPPPYKPTGRGGWGLESVWWSG